MRSERIAIVLSIALVGSVTGCHRTLRDTNDFKPLTGEARTAALDAVENLRNLLNSGECQAIYDQASESFRTTLARDWLHECEQLREKLGTWRTFYAQEAIISGYGRLANVDGLAAFGKGGGIAITGWISSEGRLRLTDLNLQSGSENVSLPDHRSVNKYWDPPVARPLRP